MFNIEILSAVGLFAGLQVINVILNSLKSLIMAKNDSPHQSALINAVTFGFYTLIVNYIAHMDLMITVPVTIVTNVIGVYITYAIFGQMKKDSLWKVEIYCPKPYDFDIVAGTLEENDVDFSCFSDKVLTAYCYTQEQSRIVAEVVKLTAEHGVKYNITEITKRF